MTTNKPKTFAACDLSTGRSEMKPCPFCGSGSISVHWLRLSRRSGYRPSCNCCGTTHGGILYSSIEQAAAAWNRRADPERIEALAALEREPAPDVAGLVEAAEAALGEIEDIMQEAYNSAYPVCCGRPGRECCGTPEPEWLEADQRMIERLEPHQKALREALAAHCKQEASNGTA